MSRWEADASGFRRVCVAATNEDFVSGYTHNYYRYPARFPPAFARVAIEEFSNPGDTIIDPFLGGGTALVEGLALGRKVIGVDLNPIAVFISSVKSTPLSCRQLRVVKEAAEDCLGIPLEVHRNAARARNEIRFANTPWWLRGTICSLLRHISPLKESTVRAFLQCALLKTSQWALDCRAELPNSSAFVHTFNSHVRTMCKEMEDFCGVLGLSSRSGGPRGGLRCRILLRSAVGIEREPRIPRHWLPAKLVITSPPYPGVHVLYHRWQVLGRKETPAPFWIAGSSDGHGASFYTLGDRKQQKLTSYYRQIQDAFRSLSRICNHKTTVVQMLAFAEPSWQLPEYLRMMSVAGFFEMRFRNLANNRDGRIWRRVPNRRWYADQKGSTGGSAEVVLFHKLS